MKTKILFRILGLWILAQPLAARAEDSLVTDPAGPSLPERVQIVSINGRSLSNHPSAISVLPGEQIAFGVDVLQYGDACPHPEGCPEGKGVEAFHWSADDRDGDECSVSSPEACRDRTQFQPDGREMIFHIPYAMEHAITIRVGYAGSSASDTLVLRNAHLAAASPPRAPLDGPPSSDTDKPLYPTLAPSGINAPYCGPYYPYADCWGPSPYYGWAGWGWGGPGWTVGFGWGFAPVAWGGWGWHPWGWYGWYYHPGIYGFYHPGWWHPGFVAASGPRLWGPRTPVLAPRANTAFVPRPVMRSGYGYRPSPAYRVRRRGGFRRGGWR